MRWKMATNRDLGWWYWLLTVGVLSAGLLGWTVGLYLAMLLCAVQITHVMWLTRDVTSFPVQVRVAYLGLLVAGLGDLSTGFIGYNWPEQVPGLALGTAFWRERCR